MKILFLTLLLSAFPLFCQAQDSVSYSYDAAGNRISRTIVLDRGMQPSRRNKYVENGGVINYLWKGAAFGAAFGVGMAGLRIGLMGTTIIPPGIEGCFDADDAAMGIKSSYPVYRRGGLIGLFVPGKTLGKDLWHFHF